MDSKKVSQLTAGMLIVTVGVLMLAGQLDVFHDFGRMWPIVFVVLAFSSFAKQDDPNRVGGALWFLFMAGIFFMHNFRVLRLHDSWPLFIVAAGLGMIFGRSPSRTDRAGSNQS